METEAGSAPQRRIKEAGQEVEEVLAVRGAVHVEVGVALEELGEEVEEILAADARVVVPVARARGGAPG